MTKYVTTRRDAPALLHEGYAYQRKLGLGVTNKDGSIPWRCKYYRSTTIAKCPATCNELTDGSILLGKSAHTCSPMTLSEQVDTEMKAEIKNQCQAAVNVPLRQIYDQHFLIATQKIGSIRTAAVDLSVRIVLFSSLLFSLVVYTYAMINLFVVCLSIRHSIN